MREREARVVMGFLRVAMVREGLNLRGLGWRLGVSGSHLCMGFAGDRRSACAFLGELVS